MLKKIFVNIFATIFFKRMLANLYAILFFFLLKRTIDTLSIVEWIRDILASEWILEDAANLAKAYA